MVAVVARSNKHLGHDSKTEVLLLLETVADLHCASSEEIQLWSLLSMMAQAQWALSVGAFADLLHLIWESLAEASSFALFQ